MSSKTTDKSVIKCLGFCGFGMGANITEVDVKDGKVARIRPLHYDQLYTPEDLNYWKIEKDGHVLEPGMQSYPPPLSTAYKMRAYSKNRIPYPLKRVDWDPHGERNTQNRGVSKYVRISWDNACDIVAEEIKRVHEEAGPFSIYAQSDGHGETKSVHAAHGCQTNLLSLIGGFLKQARQPDSWEGWYWGAKHVWGMDPVGMQTVTTNVIKDIAENGEAVFFWGADPEVTPWGWGGQFASIISSWFTDIGVKSIYICPDCNYAAAIHADKWIPVLPNTDVALQLGIAYVWMTEGTYEKDYIATHAVGFDRFEDYVLGRSDGVPKTPEWASEKCGVPDYRIKALARYWASHKVSIAHGNGGGYIRAAFSHEPARMEIYLLGMRGVGQPGVNQFQMIEWQLMGIESWNPLPSCSVLPSVEGAFRGATMEMSEPFIPKTLIPKAVTEKKLSWYGHVIAGIYRQDQFVPFEWEPEEGKGIRMIWSDAPCWSNCWQGGNVFQEAMRDPSLEFILVQHPWMENDCKFADIILPTSTILESEDFNVDCRNGQWNAIAYEEQAIQPVGEARSDYEAVCSIAKALEKFGGIYENLYERYTQGKDVIDWIEKGFRESGIVDGENADFEQFKKDRFKLFPTREDWAEQPHGLIGFYEDPEGHPLETSSGKIEYWSEDLEMVFPDDKVRGPMARWIEEPADGHDDRLSSPRAKDYPFLLVTNHPRWRVHANHDDIPWLREIGTCKVVGPDGYAYEPLYVNPADAEKLGLKDGDIAGIYNERGMVLGGVVTSERIMQGCVSQDHGSREDEIEVGVGGLDRGGANNLICPSATTSANCAGEVTNSFLVGVKKVDVVALAEQYPEEFGRVYDSDFGQVPDSWIVEE